MKRNMNCLLRTMAGVTLAITLTAGAQAPAAQAPAANSNTGTSAAPAAGSNSSSTSNEEILRELGEMKARIAQLEAELKARGEAASAEKDANALRTAAEAASGKAAPAAQAAQPVVAQAPAAPAAPAAPELTAEVTTKEAPFPGDWTWLNSNGRVKDLPMATKYFTPEIRFDANYIFDYNRPKDDSMGGSTEMFRANEWQLEQVSVGGDFRIQNTRGRILTMGGLFATTTPRNDASYNRGQWNLKDAYRYFSEAWGGYHWDVNHGLNVDAGIFVSYIGLFSYYNADNWAYQPSFVSSNTPWFFNGVRIQWFPTDKLKIEPWIINGWQSYGRYGSKPGLGGQILWRPRPWISVVSNNYGMGEDTLGSGNGQFGRSRIHTDNSVEVKYYDRPGNFLNRMAFSLTGDLGCEYGGPPGQNVNCHHNTATSYKQTFAGWMLYNRWWFMNDRYGFTLGGGAMDNPGRYLVLLPPINSAVAYTGTPYFTGNPGDPFKAWDLSATFDYMPKQWVTFRWEYGYRHANVPYWTGRGGITPPGGNTGGQGVFAGANSGGGALVPGTTFVPGPTLSATPGFTCVAGATGWCPDLRRDEQSLRMALMVMF